MRNEQIVYWKNRMAFVFVGIVLLAQIFTIAGV